MKNRKNNTNSENVVQLVSREAAEEEFGESAASVISKDMLVTWMKFILTDDMPNKNGERVQESEFDNLISTGFYKPVKMMVGGINDGHEDAEPIGVITHLTKDGGRILALAALWPTERAEDVQLLKERINDGKPVNVSWEIYYEDRELDGGIANLKNTSLRAVTIVGLPAYAGRTPVLAIASNKWSEPYVKTLKDADFLYIGADGNRYFPYRDREGKVAIERLPEIENEIAASSLADEVKQTTQTKLSKLRLILDSDGDIAQLLGAENFLEVKLDIKELEGRNAELTTKVEELTSQLEAAQLALTSANEAKASAESTAQELKDQVKGLDEELGQLREFKAEADKEQAKADKLVELREKFVAAGVDKSEEFFVENFDKLSALDDLGLEFMLQELAAFSKSEENNTASASSRSSVPNVPGSGGEVTISDLAKALRERKK